MCLADDIKLSTMDICLGFVFFTCSMASPIISCGSGWAHGHHLSGTGCLRKLNSQFNQRTCLLNGYHLTLIKVPWKDFRRRDIFCVKDEELLSEKPTTTSETDIFKGVDTDEFKSGAKTKIEEQSKENIAKALGCCLEGLQPSG